MKRTFLLGAVLLCGLAGSARADTVEHLAVLLSEPLDADAQGNATMEADWAELVRHAKAGGVAVARSASSCDSDSDLDVCLGQAAKAAKAPAALWVRLITYPGAVDGKTVVVRWQLADDAGQRVRTGLVRVAKQGKAREVWVRVAFARLFESADLRLDGPREAGNRSEVTTPSSTNAATEVAVQTPAPKLEAPLTPPASPVVSPAVASSGVPGWHRPTELALGVVGAAGLITALIFRSKASSDADAYRAGLPLPASASDAQVQQLADLYDSSRRNATVANVGLIAGGALVAAGAALFGGDVLGARSGRPSVSVAPSLGGVAVAGTFP
jgi:hypothetical protein